MEICLIKSNENMARIVKIVDKGICICCNGSGWNIIFEKYLPKNNIKRRNPSYFDLGKCYVCNGSGRRIEIL